MTRRFYLPCGRYTLVDDDDYDRLSQWKWHHHSANGGKEYVSGRIRVGGKVVRVLMHRYIMGTPPGMDTDHINGNGLDNRKSNLRIATHTENMRNRHPLKDYKGVHFRKERGVYHAYITIDKKRKNLGHFVSELAAACAYDYAAMLHFGEFAKLNFPDGCPLTPGEVESQRYQRKKISRFRGVHLFKWGNRERRWVAKIMVNYKTITIGYFGSEVEAAHAYNQAAIKYHGDNAKLNTI